MKPHILYLYMLLETALYKCCNFLTPFVDREGIEPPTHGFSVHCSLTKDLPFKKAAPQELLKKLFLPLKLEIIKSLLQKRVYTNIIKAFVVVKSFFLQFKKLIHLTNKEDLCLEIVFSVGFLF